MQLWILAWHPICSSSAPPIPSLGPHLSTSRSQGSSGTSGSGIRGSFWAHGTNEWLQWQVLCLHVCLALSSGDPLWLYGCILNLMTACKVPGSGGARWGVESTQALENLAIRNMETLGRPAAASLPWYLEASLPTLRPPSPKPGRQSVWRQDELGQGPRPAWHPPLQCSCLPQLKCLGDGI